MGALGTALAFLLEHLDVFELIYEAIAGGTSKEELKKAIRASMVAASDELMKKELGEP